MSVNLRRNEERQTLRIRIVYALMVVVLSGVLAHLWRLQVVEGHTYVEKIRAQSLRWIRYPGRRGIILDRNGILLADNRPSYNLVIYPEELRQRKIRKYDDVLALLGEIGDKIGLSLEVTRDDLARHYREQKMLPMTIWADLDDSTLARWGELVGPQKGVDLLVDPVRTYPYGDLLSHTIGYVGRGAAAAPDEDDFDLKGIEEMQGKSGMEKVLDNTLRGKAGAEIVRIDVSAFKHGTVSKRDPVPGQDVKLTIDARFQKLCEHVLGPVKGSIVVMDPNNGEVLAMASYPRYDLNKMVPFISSSVWDALRDDPRKPLVNRPVREHYAPGSTLKPFTALAALETGEAEGDHVYTCNGYIQIGQGRPKYCNNKHGHGDLDMRQAIARSCNVYFWKLALENRYDPLYNLYEEVGLGERTGVEVDYEVPGILPSDEWKKRKHGDRLRDGDIANIAIGQGFLNATPLQMAAATCTLANGGTYYAPRLIKGFRSSENREGQFSETRNPGRPLGWSADNVRVIREGMRETVMGSFGTARSARIEGLVWAGKTGTAQYGPPGQISKYRSWMIAFAPYDNPQVAVVVLVDEGKGSGVDAVPRMHDVISTLFRMNFGRGRGGNNG